MQVPGKARRFLASPEGERITPSVVAWTSTGEVLVGVPARRQAVTNAAQTIYGAKRLVGRKVNAEDVVSFARSAPFRIVAAANGDAWVRIGGQGKSPQEVASHVLRRMRALAETALGEPVTRAVVTVPAYFDEQQRQATRDAGTIAGLDVVRILNEPTAAALAYGAHRVSDRRRLIAVFDLGGGTFDVSIISVENGVFEVLSTGGDTALGGEDWDRRMVERMADEVFDRHRVDLLQSPVALGRLKEASEAAKKSLETFKAKYADATKFGTIRYTGFGVASKPLGPPNSADLLMTSRNIHNFTYQPGMLDKSMSDFFAVLKPGGVLGVEEHRADPRPEVVGIADGYVSKATVVAAAEKAGFKLAASSEVNANPKDTKDHPFGVWTLPPVKRSAPAGQPANPAFDRTKYDAIGESDRMTLRFVKPR